jgi:hypothetical protein
MTTNDQPQMGKKQLIKYLIISILIGGIVLVTAILPAEYNIDPLGAGEFFGFSKLYAQPNAEEFEIQNVPLNFKKLTIEESGSGPDVPIPVEVNSPPPAEQYVIREDSDITVVVPAGKGIEYKFKMLKYGSTKYEWSTDGSILYSDMHGEVLLENPPEEEFFESYAEAYSNNMTGTLIAPFKGIHGWYFRNKNKEDVTVNIKLKGQYQLFDIYAKH